MAKHTFVVEATISMTVEVQAESLEEAVRLARSSRVMRLCHQCSGAPRNEWHTSGELDCDPSESPLVDYHGPERFLDAESAWDLDGAEEEDA